MCGIFGVFGATPGAEMSKAALAALAARGPDGASFVNVGADGVLGHTRLAIVDLDTRADQPMQGLDGRLAIVFNGEIYNAPELRRTLADYLWTTDHSDTETILAAYARWGEHCVERLRGMFAFALWDADERRLLLAVDRFSIKPLLMAERAGALHFASTATALGALGVPLAPHLPAVHSWLADGQLETGRATFFEGIRQLPAAHCATWKDGTLTLRPYWSPPVSEPRAIADDEIDAWLSESLESHLLSDVHVGLALSSGLDSTVLRALARRAGQPLHAFTFSFPGMIYDEAARVRPVLRADDAWSVTPIAAQDMWRDFAQVTADIEMPLGGAATYGHWRNAQAAQAAGYKVLLAGEGADEVFGGYKYYAEAAIAELWRAGHADEAQRLFDAFARHDPAEWRKPPAALAVARAPGTTASLKAPDGTSLVSGFLTPTFAETPKLDAPPAARGGAVRAAMWTDLAYLKLPKLLRWQDRCYMAAGIEVRVPYLDHVLVERMAAAAPGTLFAGGVTKAPLRRLAERLLPAELLARPKLYVATPQREWLKHDLRREVEALLDPGAALVRAGLVDLPSLRAAYRRYADEAALGNSFFIWKFIAMELLFQRFFPGAGERSRLVA